MLDLPSIVVFASWALFAVTWFIAALFVKRTVERSWSFGRSSMIVVLAVGYWIARNRQLIGARQLWTPTPSIEWLAAAVVLVGLWVTLWARFALGRNWSGTVTFKQDHELIERGPYRYVRHPIYTGILVMALGTAMLHAWLSQFLFCGVLLISLWLKLQAEEQLLTRHFPEAYPRYRERVRALIPFVL
ncbi:MAG TPA: isoprenylcysteine carboxylmethyltransferase family protein [Candidatus Sulfotelmatobacter sp.]|nr:isoprenylcysteine carboxylmethyltransferase family protein [Candidatus Sulfotelmatobacter sp.]